MNYRNSLFTLVILLIATATLMAAGDIRAKSAEFEGTLICQVCELKQAEGARAACKAYGHRHTLKTDDGRFINFLENKYSTDLINDAKFHNAKVKVSGNYYTKNNLLDVELFQMDGKKSSWCEGHGTMDGCMAPKEK